VPRITKKKLLTELVTERGWPRVGEPEWGEIRATIPNIAPEDLQGLEIPVEPPWCGVRQHTLEELEATLDGLTEVYVARTDLRRFCRDSVIRARERARWASKSERVAEEKRALKTEMAEWMLVWLSDPAVFPAWVQLRRKRLEQLAGAG